MTSARQIAANRRNARLSTGPHTALGKRTARRNALRHGLTSEVVITGLECEESYLAFENEIYAAYAPQTVLQCVLVIRLAGLLWRLRRAVAVESGSVEQMDRSAEPTARDPHDAEQAVADEPAVANQKSRLAGAFGGFVEVKHPLFDRLQRYERGLWRQAVQTIFVLDGLLSQASKKGASIKFGGASWRTSEKVHD